MSVSMVGSGAFYAPKAAQRMLAIPPAAPKLPTVLMVEENRKQAEELAGQQPVETAEAVTKVDMKL